MPALIIDRWLRRSVCSRRAGLCACGTALHCNVCINMYEACSLCNHESVNAKWMWTAVIRAANLGRLVKSHGPRSPDCVPHPCSHFLLNIYCLLNCCYQTGRTTSCKHAAVEQFSSTLFIFMIHEGWPLHQTFKLIIASKDLWLRVHYARWIGWFI